MKRIFIVCLYLIFIKYINSGLNIGDVLQLPEPEKEGGMPLYEALNKRQSLRNFDPSIKLTPQILSQALWSCYGENRPNGFKTTPSAKAWYPLMIYIFLEEGVFKYESSNHVLIKILDGDHRDMAGTQTAVVTKARANIVLIGDLKKQSRMDDDINHKLRSIYLDSGHCTMGLSLFAASNNMKGVIRGMVNSDSLLELLGLTKGDYIFSLAYSLGY